MDQMPFLSPNELCQSTEKHSDINQDITFVDSQGCQFSNVRINSSATNYHGQP